MQQRVFLVQMRGHQLPVLPQQRIGLRGCGHVAGFAALPAAYVADGHHRTASAARVGLELRGKGASTPDSDWFLCVLFPTWTV